MGRTFQGQNPEAPKCQVTSYYTSDEEERTNTTSTHTSESGGPSSTGCGTSQGETKSRTEEEESMGQKKVRFDDAIYIRLMCTWSYASRQARERYWEYFVWDRQHFKARIRKFEPLYKRIKRTSHRIYIHLWLDLWRVNIVMEYSLPKAVEHMSDPLLRWFIGDFTLTPQYFESSLSVNCHDSHFHRLPTISLNRVCQ